MTNNHLKIDPAVAAERASIDILINGHRVWSVDLLSEPLPKDGVKEWPAALAPFLDGHAEVMVVDSATGEELAGQSVRLGTSQSAIAVVDHQGRWLAVNKWGRMGKSFAGAEEGLRDRLLDHLDDLVVFCESRNLRPFVVGGTLLGAVREGKILGHDDDADLAYLSRHTHPSDLALENFQIERELEARGIEVVRHSTAHLQLTFRTSSGKVDGYVDLFTAFFRDDGTINQPFHVRGPMPEASMVPFSTVTLEGRPYPAPAVPEDWLVVNYDENWRTPLPGYKLHTPQATQRRFRNWFGSYNFQRDFWEEHYESGVATLPSDAHDVRGAEYLAAHVTGGSRVVDLGCGAGSNAAWLATHGFDVTAVDYSPNALSLTCNRLGANDADVSLLRLNLNDFRQYAELLHQLADEPRPTHVLASHLLERMGHLGRYNVLRAFRHVARLGGTVVAVIDTVPAPDVSFRDPSTWHLEVSPFKNELASFGLSLIRPRLLTATPRDHQRRTLLCEIALSPGSVKGSAQ
ncbi:hypothetical protein BHE97_17495 [Aeromicrobium sp. PE09-221]|uniref:class I SAM-dependent methyltransferase n=1 Tax=Aeromicrobium sp. PE09-221 TaxID=1898043 RepID=UPI000B63D42C|nr:class I SAM-dependent methyltransferase [Aeromicrobium sp. PE09-221]OUZ07295.1 hypothetical protein BHE97_17495 [Aeromicrobium sp. PE09-221]